MFVTLGHPDFGNPVGANDTTGLICILPRNHDSVIGAQ